MRRPIRERLLHAVRMTLLSVLLIFGANVVGVASHRLALLHQAVTASLPPDPFGDAWSLSLAAVILYIVVGSVFFRLASYLESWSADGYAWEGPWLVRLRAYLPLLIRVLYILPIVMLFLAFFLIILACGFVVLTSLSAPLWDEQLRRQNFAISVALVAPLFLLTLRRTVLRGQSWKKLSDVWLKWGGVSALSVGGFGFIGLTDAGKTKLLALALSHSQMSTNTLSLMYAVVIAILFFAYLMTMLGKAQSQSDDGMDPRLFFIPAFVMAWIGDLGLSVLFTNSVILTIWAHVGG